jgi:hypothetical protein
MTTGDERPPSDFVAQLHLLVLEGAHLFEFPMVAIETDGNGAPVTYGPWDPADCSRQLLAWFDAGLIRLFADPPVESHRPFSAEEWRAWNAGEYLIWLDPPDARQLLSQPERWTVESGDGLVCVVPTDAGEAPTARFW